MEKATEGLRLADRLNPELRAKHSYNIADTASVISGYSSLPDGEKTHIAVLYDIGRRTEIAAARHIIYTCGCAVSRDRNGGCGILLHICFRRYGVYQRSAVRRNKREKL